MPRKVFIYVNIRWQMKVCHIDKQLEDDMELVLRVVVQGRACRNTANIKNRQPIGKMYIKAAFELPKFYVQIIEEELNVKTVEFAEDVSASHLIPLNRSCVRWGPKYGKLGAIRKMLSEIDGNKAMLELKNNGQLKLED